MFAKTMIVILAFTLIHMRAFNQNLNDSIELKKQSYTLEALIFELENQHNLKFAYNSDILTTDVIIHVQNQRVCTKSLIELMSRTYNLKATIKKSQIILTPINTNSKVTISGCIYDYETGESLPAASIIINNLNIGCATNNYGFYSFSLNKGEYSISYSYMGYKTTTKSIKLHKNEFLPVYLNTHDLELKEVTINDNQANSKTNRIEVGMERLTMKDISALPAFLGEVDVLKGMQYLPGVQGINDGISLISVRGGTFDQNLILLDEAPVYNPTHVLGFFSVFNPDVVTQAEIYKGYIPSQFGGRLSSTIDIRMKEGNRNKLGVSASVNNYASRLTIETPLFNKNTSIIVAGRYSYPSLTPLIGQELNGTILFIPDLNNYSSGTKINFWDINAKINHKINSNNHLYFSTYSGHDYFYYPRFETNSSMEWGNTTATLRWNHIFNTGIFVNTSAIFSNYNYSYLFFDNGYNYNWKAGMQEINLKSDFEWYANTKNKFKFGVALNNHLFSPGQISPLDTISTLAKYKLEERYAFEPSLYISHKFSKNNIVIESGIRINGFVSTTAGNIEDSDNTFFNLAPRLALMYKLNNPSSLKLSYSRTYQYMHLLKNANIGLPTDIWLPSGKGIKPQNADQLSFGYFADLFQNKLEFSTETYYKKMNNIIDYLDNADLFLKENIESEIGSGKGISYGIEFMLSKKTGVFKGNVSYTLAKSEKTIEGINYNQPYPFSHDNRHCIDANVSIDFGKRWTFMSSFVYKSGAATTMIESYYFYEGIPFAIYSNRNGYRLPAYHKLDMAITKKSKEKEGRNWASELSFGVNNIYNRKNTFVVFLNKASNLNLNGPIKQLYLFGTIPFLSYAIKF